MTIDAQKLHNRSRDRNEDCLIVAMRVANPLLRVQKIALSLQQPAMRGLSMRVF